MKRTKQKSTRAARMLAQVAALRCHVRDTVLLRSVLNSGGVARVGALRFHGVYEKDEVEELNQTTPHHHLYRLLPDLWSQEFFHHGAEHDASR